MSNGLGYSVGKTCLLKELLAGSLLLVHDRSSIYNRGMSKWEWLTVGAFLLGVVALFMEQAEAGPVVGIFIQFLDFAILGLILWSSIGEIRNAKYPSNYIRTYWLSLAFVVVYTGLFLYSKYTSFSMHDARDFGALSVLLRNVFLVLKILSRMRKVFKLFERMARRPAQTVIVSFLFVIATGALLLMTGRSTVDGLGLGFVDAFFTATSAVCVTGLIVVDTAVTLTRTGQLIVLVLIQIGGLGIMLFSFFVMIALRQRLSVQDRLTVSFMLSEDDMVGLTRSVRMIVVSTFSIEFAGALVLFSRFVFLKDSIAEAAFHSVFHAVSAFCNAGFALYSDSLESFRYDPLVILAIASLIVLGGISFGVINDLKHLGTKLFGALTGRLKGTRTRIGRIGSMNTRVVLAFTAVLIATGFCGFYLLEHQGVMAEYDLGDQYLNTLFQSVTLRTAGFNSVSFMGLRDATLLFMIVFMFIGGASGSTAGGIKVNSLAAIGAFFISFLQQEKSARLGGHAVSSEKVGRAFLILFFGLSTVLAGTFVLSLTEEAPFLALLFEAVSAFGTVGLSTGVTPYLSVPGKGLIIILMFIGRLGPLTILTAASTKNTQGRIEYPQGDLAIG
jgi:trk system potassium uptake protein